MKTIFINMINIGDIISDEMFAVRSLKRSQTKDGRPYLDIELCDKTGILKGKIWSENIETCDDVKSGDIVRIYAKVGNFNDLPQLNISSMQKSKDYSIEDFTAVSSHNLEKMEVEFKEYINCIKDKHLKKLLENIFVEETYEKFVKSPAAYTIHHAYVGGLLEHTLDLLEMAKVIASRYPKINQDLLYTGVILHDIGKLEEYSTGTTISITTKGKLLGHIFIGAEIVKNKAPKDMPEKLVDEVVHLILSHQGSLEFGSPVLPKTVEAITLSALDDASFKINTVYHTVHDGNIEEFTAFQRHLGTDFYRSSYKVDDEEQELL